MEPPTAPTWRELFAGDDLPHQTHEGVERILDRYGFAGWQNRYGRQLGDVCAGLKWAFSADGGSQIGAALTAAAVPDPPVAVRRMSRARRDGDREV